MKIALKISLVFTTAMYVLNNIYSALNVFGVVPDGIYNVLSPVNVNYINMAAGLLVGVWLLISYNRSAGKFPIALIAFFLLCFFEPLLGTLAVALFYRLNETHLGVGEKDIIDTLIS